MCDRGATGMAEALKVNSTFERLDMSDNMIGDVGALALAEASKFGIKLYVERVSLCHTTGRNAMARENWFLRRTGPWQSVGPQLHHRDDKIRFA